MTTESILAPVAALTLPDSMALTGRAQQALAFIEGFQIATAEDYALAADELKAIKARSKDLEGQRTGITGPINEALRAINNLFRGPSDLLTKAEETIKRKMLAWQAEQERIAAEARRKAEAEAEAQRKKLEEEAAAAQAAAQVQIAAAQAAAAAGDVQAEEFARAAAERAQAEANAAATEAHTTVAATVIVAAPAVKGIATVTRVDFEVTSLLALVQHVAANPELINLVRADDVKLRAYVKGLGLTCKLPGVKVFPATGLSARAA